MMAQKIYKLALIRGYTEAYYQLSDAEKAKLWERVGEVVGAAGGKMATPFYSSRWANDKYERFFIMEYPDLESALADTDAVEGIELFRYMVSETILGIEAGDEMP
jgi:hypothetical protein